MSSSITPFIVASGSTGVNTRIEYRFDTSVRTVKGSVVVDGKFTDEDIKSLRENLEDGASFVPRKLGLPDLSYQLPNSWNGDEVEHVIERISLTNAKSDPDAPSIDQLVSLSETFDLHSYSTDSSAAAQL